MPVYTNQTDRELLDLLAQGDAFAFRQIYDRFFPELYKAARRFLRDDKAAEDLVQDIFT